MIHLLFLFLIPTVVFTAVRRRKHNTYDAADDEPAATASDARGAGLRATTPRSSSSIVLIGAWCCLLGVVALLAARYGADALEWALLRPTGRHQDGSARTGAFECRAEFAVDAEISWSSASQLLRGYAEASKASAYTPHINSWGQPSLTGDKESALKELLSVGLWQLWAFNTREAARALRLAAALEPRCLLCHAGHVLALGPFPNRVGAAQAVDWPHFGPSELREARDVVRRGLRATASLTRAAADCAFALEGSPAASDAPCEQRCGVHWASVRLMTALEARFAVPLPAGVAHAEAEAAFARGLHEVGRSVAKCAKAGSAWARPWAAWLLGTSAAAHLSTTPWDYHERRGPKALWRGEGREAYAAAAALLRPAGAARLRTEAAQAGALAAAALVMQPGHPLALHLLIHLRESAEPAPLPRLRDVLADDEGAGNVDEVVGADVEGQSRRNSDIMGVAYAHDLARSDAEQGHLVHMPSHAFVRAGKWAEAVEADARSHAADLREAQKCRVPYLPEHNINMRVYAASASGNATAALQAVAQKMRVARDFPPEALGAKGGQASGDGASLPLVLLRFGMWADILALEPPAGDARGPVASHGGAEFARAAHAFAQAAARLALEHGGDEAHRALHRAAAALSSVPADVGTAPGDGNGIYSGEHVRLAGFLDLLVRAAYIVRGSTALPRAQGPALEASAAALPSPAHVAEALQLPTDGCLRQGGERSGDLALALAMLARATVLEDEIGYREPPALLISPMQCLARALEIAGCGVAAAQVYVRDLELHPRNAWSASGLAAVLRGLGRESAARALDRALGASGGLAACAALG
ncbi:unnamed protein product [Pedinophyceae sp. YPF-701]|nr:unnamed protein product [Pedinophyceae sp. YPF-701]